MRVLIVDDEKNIREALGKYLGLENIEARTAESGEAARSFLEAEKFDALVLDLKLPGMSGQELLEWTQKQGFSSPVIMISAHGEIPDAVNALKAGAKDYLVKPFDPAELVIRLRSLVENKRRENLIEAGLRTSRGKAMLGESPVMRELSARIDKIAASDATVLITGESGTGKEVAAREIHARSPYRDEPFVAVNIGGIHEGLMESELFGHEKGSFTGAGSRKTGLFEIAGRGTLFLDEIGEMPMPLQVKLLRVLQERKIRRLGGVSDIPVSARIVSATNRDLENLVKEGRFREDLYYRLNVVRISLPPLRERKEDIPLLVAHILAKRSSRPCAVSGEAMAELSAWAFPGNIRELENILERALIYCGDNLIRPADIDLHKSAPAGGPGLRPPTPLPEISPQNALPPSLFPGESPGPQSLEELERRAIADALARCKGNRTRAAEMLGLSRKTILNKIKAYGL
jgi:two-component system response regulator AtoC